MHETHTMQALCWNARVSELRIFLPILREDNLAVFFGRWKFGGKYG